MSGALLLVPALGAAGAGAAQDIRDIRGPIAIPSLWPTVLLVAAVVVAAVALAAAAYALVRHFRRGRAKTPAQIALARLDEARSLATEGHAAELGEAISDTVRAYIEARFELCAPKRATEEFLHDLASASESPLARHRDALAAFLGACDLAKFARFAIDVEHQLAMIDTAAEFVRATDATPAVVERHAASPHVLSAEEVRP